MLDKLRKRINTQIELTSLLDVIFIVLMIVVCNQQINMTSKTAEIEAMQQQAQVEMAEAEDLKAEAEAAKELFEEHQDTYTSIDENLSVMTIYASYVPSNPQNREIRILAGDRELPAISLNPGNSKDAFAEFERELDTEFKNAYNAQKPVIISINTEKILYRDANDIESIINKLSKEYGNIYYKAGE